jgi:hypothetical protein
VSARALASAAARAACSAWTYLRAVTGDSAYEAYRERTRGRPLRVLSREEFYLDRLRRRYAGVSRCC